MIRVLLRVIWGMMKQQVKDRLRTIAARFIKPRRHRGTYLDAQRVAELNDK